MFPNKNRSFQEKCIYVKLNIGISGKIINKHTIININQKYSPGDILKFEIIKYDSYSMSYILDLMNGKPDTSNGFKLNYNAKSYVPTSKIKHITQSKIEKTSEDIDKGSSLGKTKLCIENMGKYIFKPSVDC